MRLEMALRQSQPPHICFYSNKCDWSEAFIKELSTTQYKQEFQFVCVDTTPKSQLPNWLKQVPTLLIKGDPEPVKVNSDVLNWLYERKMKDTSRSPTASSGMGGGSGPRTSATAPRLALPICPTVMKTPIIVKTNEIRTFLLGRFFQMIQEPKTINNGFA